MGDRWRTATVAAVVLLVVLAVVAGWSILRDGESQPPALTGPSPSVDPSQAPETDTCSDGARNGFKPVSIAIPGVVRSAAVIGVPRDDSGVPGVLPTSQKSDFAWDLGGIEPGSRRGQVLLNVHTWPDGTAMGNRLLAKLGEGDQLMVRGAGRHLCYRVTDEVEVAVEDGYEGYDRSDGPPVLVIVVCSGERRGPGDWSHRTLWFAEPVR